jgi:hypothetical protein
MFGVEENKCSVVWRPKVRRKFSAAKNKCQKLIKLVSGLSQRTKEAVEKFKFWPRVPL